MHNSSSTVVIRRLFTNNFLPLGFHIEMNGANVIIPVVNTPLSRHLWPISLTRIVYMRPYPSCTAVRLSCHFCYCVFEAWVILGFWKLKLLRVSLLLCIPRRRRAACRVTKAAAGGVTAHLRRGQYTTSTPLATLASRNTGSSTLQKHNNKSDTTNARQYMKDTDAYYKRKLMRLTKGGEKVVYLTGQK